MVVTDHLSASVQNGMASSFSLDSHYLVCLRVLRIASRARQRATSGPKGSDLNEGARRANRPKDQRRRPNSAHINAFLSAGLPKKGLWSMSQRNRARALARTEVGASRTVGIRPIWTIQQREIRSSQEPRSIHQCYGWLLNDER